MKKDELVEALDGYDVSLLETCYLFLRQDRTSSGIAMGVVLRAYLDGVLLGGVLVSGPYSDLVDYVEKTRLMMVDSHE